MTRDHTQSTSAVWKLSRAQNVPLINSNLGDENPPEALLAIIPLEPSKARGDRKHRFKSDSTTLLDNFRATMTTRSNLIAIAQLPTHVYEGQTWWNPSLSLPSNS